eukprot:CAMPEP_0114497792 /NCGR_PEP_ID=MMETSP0109-20121206/6522_1 /TAXON_ID=29199 /ORGANISM="Chlorarachnion reptans, Strain CCCM449" /LENGTH=109 /DNA_ID=CAMNT_0001675215 /DNA_START=498 /DNA_END=828 /DNA_ORIENTATION=+
MAYFPGFKSQKAIPGIVFPNTIVDFQYNTTSGKYDWVIEFQCVEKLNHVWFVGINFYSMKPHLTQEEETVMLNAARKQGIGMYMDKGLGLYKVSQDGCKYDPPPPNIEN